MQVVQVILILGAVQGIFLAIVLGTSKRGNRTANSLLTAIISLFSLNILVHTLEYINEAFAWYNHSYFLEIIFFLIGPLVYLYVKSLTSPGFRLAWTDLRYGYFFLGGILFYSTTQLLFGRIEDTIAEDIVVTVILGQNLYFVIRSLRTLRIHSKAIQEKFSSLAHINLRWLYVLLAICCLIWIMAAFLEILDVSKDINWDYIWLVISICLYLIGYLGMRQPEIFVGNLEKEEIQQIKYQKSTLSKEKVEQHANRLEKMMEEDQSFLNMDITLNQLATRLSISSHHLSQIINTHFQMNFFQFINSYRIEEAKKRLLDPEKHHLNIAAIAFEVGFSSLSSFNTAFKKHTGLTPSQFRKES